MSIDIKPKFNSGDVVYFHQFAGLVDDMGELHQEIKKATIKGLSSIDMDTKKVVYLLSTGFTHHEDGLYQTKEKAINSLITKQINFAESLKADDKKGMEEDLNNIKIMERRIKSYNELLKILRKGLKD